MYQLNRTVFFFSLKTVAPQYAQAKRNNILEETDHIGRSQNYGYADKSDR